MVDVLKEPTDVGFDQKAELAVRQFEGQIAHRILGVSPRSIAVGAIEEVFCVDRPQQPGAGELHELVRQRRDAQWPFFSVLFGDVDAPHALRTVAPRLHTLRQIGDMTVQIGRVDFCRQPVSPSTPLAAPLFKPCQQRINSSVFTSWKRLRKRWCLLSFARLAIPRREVGSC